MERLRHGYTNDTRGDGTVVVKRYEGPDAALRRRCEREALIRLQGMLPVPRLFPSDEGEELRMEFVAGVQGQELIDAGHAGPVLSACGEALRRVHALGIVHGDYGPNNVLLESVTFAVTAVLDWEWARAEAPIDDLAWCEWIVRMHHGAHVAALDGFFDAYGMRPAWALRRAAMLAQCERLLEMCRRWSPDSVRLWRHRRDVTSAWTE